jgi:hypothetical protein
MISVATIIFDVAEHLLGKLLDMLDVKRLPLASDVLHDEPR